MDGASMRSILTLLGAILLMSSQQLPGALPNDSIFGKNVYVFDDSMGADDIQGVLDHVHARHAGQEFTDERVALLFQPGTYRNKVTVDYYVQALGLGRTPGDVVVHGAVQSTWSRPDNKVTIQFWRGAENFKVHPDTTDRWMLWAVSQAAPLRRMHILGDVNFDKGSWASGGVLANSIVTGRAGLTSGQQWFTRNSRIGSWEGGVWNRVFVGVEGAPEPDWPATPTTVVDKAPILREKPFLLLTEEGDYAVFVPELRRETSGVTWEAGDEKGSIIPVEEFYIAHADQDDAESINQALAKGRHLLLTPGIYSLDQALTVEHPNTVILGIGLPTLVPTDGNTALKTTAEAGVIIAGIMVDAGMKESDVLVQIGDRGSSRDHEENPTSLHDLYIRVGGALAGTAKTCLEINTNHVIGDHFWLWRADHGAGADWNINRSGHGLVVNGDDVTIYGLFNEHFQGYQTLWNGERGRTYFYQCEIPYEPPSNEDWNDDGRPGYAAYKVADHVAEHAAWGLGIYSFFRGEQAEKNGVRLENAMEVPDRPGIRIEHIVTFSGRVGGINHVINGKGPTTENGGYAQYDGWNVEE